MSGADEMRGFTSGKVPPIQPQKNQPALNVRALLESTGTPFAVVHYSPRAAVFFQGDPCDSVMHIEKGRVRLAVTARDGREAICGLLGIGAFLGEEALGGRVARRQTATAMTATQLLVVAKAQMVRLLRMQPAMMDQFLAHLFARNTRLEADLTDQLLYTSEQRLAHTLLVLADCDERHPCRGMLPRVSQAIMAEMVGTTRARVNAFMGRFKKVGFIEEKSGGLQVNPSRLHVAYAGGRRISRGASRALPQAVTPWGDWRRTG